MAEYIDRTIIPYAKLSEFDKGSLVTRDMIERMSPADVIEREKIDKAIKEIIEYRDDDTNDFDPYEVGAINEALAILKRNIGE